MVKELLIASLFVEACLILFSLYILNGRRLIVTPLVFILFVEMLFSLPTCVVLFDEGVASPRAVFIIMAIPFSTIAGAFFFQAVLMRRKIALKCHFLFRFSGRNYSRMLFFFLVAAIAMAFLNYRGLPPITEILLSPGEHAGFASQMRLEYKAYVFGEEAYRGQGIYKFVMRGLLYSVSIMAFFAIVHIQRGKRLKKFIMLSVIGLSAVLLIGIFEKFPFVLLIAALVMLFTATRNIRTLDVLKASLVIFMALLASFIILGRNVDFSTFKSTTDSTLKSIANRVLQGNGHNTIYAIEEYPVRRGLGFGREHWNRIKNALPGKPQPPLGYYLYTWITGKENVRKTYASTTYLAYAYSDFGFPGAVFLYFCIGLIGEWINRAGMRAMRHPILTSDKPLWGILWIYYAQIAFAGPTKVIMGLFTAFSVFFFFSVIMISANGIFGAGLRRGRTPVLHAQR